MARRSSARRVQRRRAALAQWSLPAVAVSHLGCVACLHAIGRLPVLRIDALWVRAHQHLVIALLLAAVASILATLGVLLGPRRAWLVLAVIWSLTAWIAAAAFADELRVIATVLDRHVLR